jgi:peptide/nickel transport system permease protein
MSAPALSATPAPRATGEPPSSPAAELLRRFARDRAALVALALLTALALAAIFASALSRDVLHRSPDQLQLMGQMVIGGRSVDVVSGDGIPVGPNAHALLGVDLLGRDILARLLFGARVSLVTSLLGTLLALLIGLSAGLLAGYYGGLVDAVLSRFVDAMMAIPVLLLAIALASVLRQGSVAMVVLVLALVNWTYLARIIRAEVLSLRQREFVEAARATGAGDAAILVRHLLPNLVGPLLVFATISVAGNILLESALSFLGVGIQPPTPSWGNMIQEGIAFYRVAWWITLFPGLAILLTVTCLNLVGEAVRDALEPARRGMS